VVGRGRPVWLKTSSVLSRRDLRPGHAHGGSTGTWEISSLPPKCGDAGRRDQTRGLRESRTCAQEPEREHEDSANERYRRAKATKRSGTSDEKSETPVVPTKPENSPHEDPVEGRGVRITEPNEGTMAEALNSGTVTTRLERIAELARKHPERVFMSLHHVIDVDWLREAYRRTRKDASAGADGQTAEEYARDLESNLEALLARFRTGTYRAPPVRRVHIPKGDGRTRPIGVPTFEDKVLQRAVAMLLEAIYEQDFHPSSYGFRPGRGAHDALEHLWEGLMSQRGGWVLEVDIRSFFDTLDHGALRRFLDERVTDGVLRRAIDKWLKAGVLEEGAVTHPESGTPQGGVISPILANVYLHGVLDGWFERDVKPRLRGRAFFVRYADDFVIGFVEETDARRVKDVLAERFAKYGLTLHPDKTRLLKFSPPHAGRDDEDDDGPGSFDFLGFTHPITGPSRGRATGSSSDGRCARVLRGRSPVYANGAAHTGTYRSPSSARRSGARCEGTSAITGSPGTWKRSSDSRTKCGASGAPGSIGARRERR
jgi:RNA-directed DNA polymerase